eukprot:gene10176-13692_t
MKETIYHTLLILLIILCVKSGHSNYSNYPKLGPWIVHFNENLSHTKFHNKLRTIIDSENAASKQDSSSNYKVLHNFIHVLHATVIFGLTQNQLESIEDVDYVYPDLETYTLAYSWGIDRLDQNSLPLSSSYTPSFDGTGVDVYIIDTGLDTTHSEFSYLTIKRNISNIYNPYGAISSNTDGHGHGTHVAGTVGGNTIGVSKGVNLFGMKVQSDSGSGSSSYSIAALDMVKSRHSSGSGKKSVVNMSLGTTCVYENCKSDSMLSAVQNAVAAGIVVVVAAGNSYCNSCAYTSPAAAANAITVGATTQTDGEAYFSNFGQCIDIWAPGYSINSACSSILSGCSGGGSYSTKSGTSMACPHVAGVAAQLLQKSSSSVSTPAQISYALTCDAVKSKVYLDSKDTLSKNLLAQIPKNDGSFGSCSTGSGCDSTSCNSNNGVCLPAHLSSSYGSISNICHCDGAYYGNNCQNYGSTTQPTFGSCSSSSTSYMPIQISLQYTTLAYVYSSYAIYDTFSKIVTSYAYDSLCSDGSSKSGTRNYCVPAGSYTFQMSGSSVRSTYDSYIRWTLCGKTGGANFEGTFTVLLSSAGVWSCSFDSPTSKPTLSPSTTRISTSIPSSEPSSLSSVITTVSRSLESANEPTSLPSSSTTPSITSSLSPSDSVSPSIISSLSPSDSVSPSIISSLSPSDSVSPSIISSLSPSDSVSPSIISSLSPSDSVSPSIISSLSPSDSVSPSIISSLSPSDS